MSEQEIRRRIAQLEIEINPLQAELASLNKSLLELKSQFKVGDVISWNEGKRCGRVIGIEEWCCGKPCWKVIAIKKDGTDRRAAETVRSYNNPEKVQA